MDEFTSEQREAWNSVAAAWRKWWPKFEDGAQVLNDRLLELAGVAPGHRVLDNATGIGEPSVSAARIVGDAGYVLACDLSPGMLALGRERAAELGLSNIRFAEHDAEQFEHDGEPFDAAICRWGLMLMRNPVAAARRVHAALRPGARFAAAVWSHPDEVPLLAAAGRALRAALDLPAPDPGEPGPFAMPDPDDVQEVLRAAGFDSVTGQRVELEVSFDSAREYAALQSEMSSSARKILATVDAAARQRLVDAIATAAEPFTTADGRVTFRNVSHCAVGCRP